MLFYFLLFPCDNFMPLLSRIYNFCLFMFPCLLPYTFYSSHSRVVFNWRCFKSCIILFLLLSLVLPSWRQNCLLCFLPSGSPRSCPSLALHWSSLTIWVGHIVQPCDLLLWLWVPRWDLKQKIKSITVCGDAVLTSWLPAKFPERYAEVNCKGGQGFCHVKSPVLQRERSSWDTGEFSGKSL